MYPNPYKLLNLKISFKCTMNLLMLIHCSEVNFRMWYDCLQSWKVGLVPFHCLSLQKMKFDFKFSCVMLNIKNVFSFFVQNRRSVKLQSENPHTICYHLNNFKILLGRHYFIFNLPKSSEDVFCDHTFIPVQCSITSE